MENILKIKKELNLYEQFESTAICYHFFDQALAKFTNNPEIKIRQVVDHEELIQLSDARKRMYGQRDEYFKRFYENDLYIDQKDLDSYLFACFYKGEIVGIQRISHTPFEIENYLDNETLEGYLGQNYKDRYVEFSKLLVDKEVRIPNLANALGVIGGTLVAIVTGKDNYVTYSKPHLKRKNLDLDVDNVTFKIPSRNNDDYQLFKGTMSKDIQRLFSIPGENKDAIIGNLLGFIHRSQQATEAGVA